MAQSRPSSLHGSIDHAGDSECLRGKGQRTFPCPMSCEGDLTSADVENLDATASSHTLSRVSGSSESTNLFPFIAHHLCDGINLQRPEALKDVLRPHHERDQVDEEKSVTNLDDDDGVIVNIRFSEMVRVRSVLLSAPPFGVERVTKCRLWVNRPDGIDLGDVDSTKPDQDFELLEGERGAVEYPVRVSRFANVSSLCILLSPSTLPGHLRVFYLGFKGGSRSYQREPGQQLSVAAQNAADAPVDGIRERYGASQTTIR